MNENLIVLAKAGYGVRAWAESGTVYTVLDGTDDYHILKAARELIRQADYLVFGDDYRWFHASTPKRVMNSRWRRYFAAIKAEYQ